MSTRRAGPLLTSGGLSGRGVGLRRGLALTLALGVCSPGGAFAQALKPVPVPEQAPGEPALTAQPAGIATSGSGMVRVELSSTTPGSVVALYRGSDPKDSPPYLICKAPCGGNVPQGRYLLKVGYTKRTLKGQRWVEVTAPTSITVKPNARTQRTGGLVAGLAGPPVTLIGLALIAADTFDGDKDPTGLYVTMIGLSMTIGGWILFGLSYQLGLEYKQLSPAVTRLQRERLNVSQWAPSARRAPHRTAREHSSASGFTAPPPGASLSLRF